MTDFRIVIPIMYLESQLVAGAGRPCQTASSRIGHAAMGSV